MHMNDRGQIVTSSNFNIDLEYVSRGTSVLDGGKIYSKYARYGDSSITSPLLGKLMSGVTEFTLACYLHKFYPYSNWVYFLNRYITLSADDSAEKLSAQINNGNKINLTSFDDGGDPWKHIAVVLHDRKFTFYVNGIKQADTAYQEYNDEKWNEIWYNDDLDTDDLCLILNQAIWTDNFTPPEEPLLGDLKYKTELWPENTIIVDHGNPGDLLVKLY